MNTPFCALSPKSGLFRPFRVLAVCFVVLACCIGPALALDVPPLTGRVNDRAGVLAPETRTQLEGELAALEQANGAQHGTQIALLTIPSLEGENLEQYSLKVAESWALGQKGKDNGALLLVAMKEREVRIEVGYGLEGVLTDLVSGRIIRGEIVPAFKKGEYDAGVAAGLRAMMQTVQAGEYQPGSAAQKALEAGEEVDLKEILLLLVAGSACLGAATWQRLWLAGLLGAAVGGFLGWLFVAPLYIVATVLAGVLTALAAAWGAAKLGLGDASDSSSGGGFFGGGSSGGGFSGGGGGFGGGGSSGKW